MGTEPGTGEPCAYCGAENLVSGEVASATSEANKQARALGATTTLAVATARHAVWSAVCMPAIAVTTILAPLAGVLALVLLVVTVIERMT